MIFERIKLENEGEEAYLDTYVADQITGLKRKAILVIPGGGYGGVCCDREGEPIAMAFLPYGFNAFVLHYSVAANNKPFPAQLIQASKAMKHIKDNAVKYGIDAESVFAVGFSAGGHLTASLGVLWDDKRIYDAIDMPFGYNKPTGIMPIYPVISSDEDIAHIDSFKNLWCTQNPTPEQLEETSIEKHVRENASPAFIVHTFSDGGVRVKNSLHLAEAYANANVPFELHIFPNGPHGMSLGNAITQCENPEYLDKGFEKWVELAVIWANKL